MGTYRNRNGAFRKIPISSTNKEKKHPHSSRLETPHSHVDFAHRKEQKFGSYLTTKPLFTKWTIGFVHPNSYSQHRRNTPKPEAHLCTDDMYLHNSYTR
jgi:hypothetical protein